MKHYLRLFSVPLLLLVLSLSFQTIWAIFNLPPAEALAKTAELWFDAYGLPAIFASAILEGMLLVGGYFPGVFVIFLGVVLTNSPIQAIAVVTAASVGLIIAHIINYTLGRYGWYRLLVKFGLKNAVETEREKIANRGTIAIFLSYWIPSAAAITDTAAGITRMPFKKFILASLASTIVWNVVVGTLIYLFKDSALSIVGGPGSSGSGVFYAIIATWIAILFIADFYKNKE